MASEVDICNRALQKLGAKRITSLTENTANARACNVAYEPLRDAELSAHPWKFAIERVALAADSSDPAWGRARSFQLPSDFLELTNDYPEDNLNSKDWVIEGQKILTDDTDPIYVRYIKRVTDTAVFHPLFVEALSAKLAFELCEEITQSNSKKESLRADYDAAIAMAKKRNAFYQAPAKPAEDEWITARF